ncbi:MAG: hypothetical protein ACK52K_11245 [Alphaproteobacteria bacterium]
MIAPISAAPLAERGPNGAISSFVVTVFAFAFSSGGLTAQDMSDRAGGDIRSVRTPPPRSGDRGRSSPPDALFF